MTRTEYLSREAGRAVERIMHARAIAAHDAQLAQPSPFTAIWAALTVEEQTARWAQAAALLARCELTLDERRATR
jgi:hypothetical protein